MKLRHRSSLSILFALALLAPSFTPADSHAADIFGSADPFTGVSQSHDSTLNDLLRRLPRLGRGYEESLAGLGAIQEQMLIHERKMRGEGLPDSHRPLFAANYDAILTVVVEDRITMAYGRELLRLHRELLSRAYQWQDSRTRDPEYGNMIILALEELRDEMIANAEPLSVVPDCVRTPMIKGHQLWIEELLYFGYHCRSLSRGELGALRIRAARLERFEGYYKRDGHLSRIERENLHERLIDLNRELVDALRS